MGYAQAIPEVLALGGQGLARDAWDATSNAADSAWNATSNAASSAWNSMTNINVGVSFGGGGMSLRLGLGK